MATTPEQGDASFEQEVVNGSGAGVGSGAAAAEETADAVAAVTSPQAITVNVMDDSRRPQKPPKSTPAVAPRVRYTALPHTHRHHCCSTVMGTVNSCVCNNTGWLHGGR